MPRWRCQCSWASFRPSLPCRVELYGCGSRARRRKAHGVKPTRLGNESNAAPSQALFEQNARVADAMGSARSRYARSSDWSAVTANLAGRFVGKRFVPTVVMTPAAADLHDAQEVLAPAGEGPIDLSIFISCYNERAYIISTI